MEVEKLGEEFIDGGIVNLDNSPLEVYTKALEKISVKKEEIIKQINKLLKQD